MPYPYLIAAIMVLVIYLYCIVVFRINFGVKVIVT